MKKIRLPIFILIVLLGFQNCARVAGFSSLGSTSKELASSIPIDDPITEPGVDMIQAPYAMLTGEQVLKGMLNVTGVSSTTVPAAVNTEFTSRKGVYAIGPDLKSTTSPMIVGITSLGGEVCNSLITTEQAITVAANRNFFGSIDFTKTASAVTADQYDSVVRSLARNFWGRNETTEEKQLIITGKTEFIASQTTSTSANLMLFTCAAMLSSFDAITY